MTDATRRNAPQRSPGRPTEQPLTVSIRARCSPAQLDKFHALGGSEWLRKQIDAASIHVGKPETGV